MPLIVLDDELSRFPRCLMHVLNETHPIFPAKSGRGPGIVRFKIEVKMFAFIHKVDRGVLFVGEF